jgi:hypothetical protein
MQVSLVQVKKSSQTIGVLKQEPFKQVSVVQASPSSIVHTAVLVQFPRLSHASVVHELLSSQLLGMLKHCPFRQ